MLTVSLAARLNGLASSLPFSHSFILAVAGSCGASIEYSAEHGLALQGHVRRDQARVADERGHRRFDHPHIGRRGAFGRRHGERLPELVDLDDVGHELRLAANVDDPADAGQRDQQRQDAEQLPGLACRNDAADVLVPGTASRQVGVLVLAVATAPDHRFMGTPGIGVGERLA
jgi:hypothetical protein